MLKPKALECFFAPYARHQVVIATIVLVIGIVQLWHSLWVALSLMALASASFASVFRSSMPAQQELSEHHSVMKALNEQGLFKFWRSEDMDMPLDGLAPEYLLEIIPVGISVWPMKETMEEMIGTGALVLNQAFVRMMGYEDDADFSIEYGMFSSEETQINDLIELRKVHETGVLGPYERPLNLCDGTKLAVRLNGVVFTAAGNDYLLVTAENISDLQQVESALVKARVEAEGAARIKADFLANMSHEIRTPMGGIIGLAQLCLKTPLTTSQRNYLSKIESSANSLLSVINDVLDFSKIESGKLEIQHKAFLLSDLTHDLIDKVALTAEQSGIRLYFRVDPHIPAELIGDRFRLGQVLTNLTNNAVKFTAKGGEVFVNISLQQQAGNRILLLVSVKDTGVGISRDDQTRLFTDFSQLDNSASRHFGGTGLGLSISKKLVELMNGNIWVHSELGVGSEFSFTTELKFEAERNQQIQQNWGVLAGRRVLLADDNCTAKTLTIDMLKSFDCLVDTTSTTNIAEFLSGSPQSYDVLIVDISERSVCQQVLVIADSASPYYRDIAVVGVSPLAVSSDKAQLLIDSVLSAVVTRPVTSSALLEAMAEALNLKVIAASPEAASQPSVKQLSENLRGSKLLAEDNDINQEVIIDILENEGIEVDVAANGALAVDLVKQNRYDGVLMDCQMPVMDGYEATQKLRSLNQCQQLPIIALTANVMEQDRQRAIDAGMNDHIGKPIDVQQMFTTLAKWIVPAGQPVDSKALAKSKNVVADDFPELNGIDRVKAIAITRGNAALYKRMLRRFAQQYHDIVKELNGWLDEGDVFAISDKAHAIKGVSAHLGAKNLHSSSAMLERAAKDNQPLKELVAAVCSDIDCVLVSIRTYFAVEDEQQPTHEPNNTLVLAWLKQLQQLIANCDVEALAKVQELKPFCESPELTQVYYRLETALNQFDFDTAEAQLITLSDVLNATNS